MCTQKRKIVILFLPNGFIITERISQIHLPGHRWILHAFDWSDGPRQLFPPADGGGLLQVLLRYCIPPPQDLLHSPKEVQDDHWPSTKRYKKADGMQEVVNMAMKRFWCNFFLVVCLLDCFVDYTVGLGHFFATALKDGTNLKLPHFTLNLVSWLFTNASRSECTRRRLKLSPGCCNNRQII